MIDAIHELVTQSWAKYSTTAGGDNAASYKLLSNIKALVALSVGKDASEPQKLTEGDFKQFGLRRDYFLSALSRSATDYAKEATAEKPGTISLDNYSITVPSAISSPEGVLKDTEYYWSGGMAHAKNVISSLSGNPDPVAALQKANDQYVNAQAAMLPGAVKIGKGCYDITDNSDATSQHMGSGCKALTRSR